MNFPLNDLPSLDLPKNEDRQAEDKEVQYQGIARAWYQKKMKIQKWVIPDRIETSIYYIKPSFLSRKRPAYIHSSTCLYLRELRNQLLRWVG
uniref:Uncharacterized protein n=1 Tax=Picea glauca TaxID=3330 RepID=A0A117NHS5_PICGL|nr:hypothetical protein ABT39_MTgene4121 [Picea glauca]QHR92569.1 hypothetical protein Q903MT_gene6615 [Picea sitchensis]